MLSCKRRTAEVLQHVEIPCGALALDCREYNVVATRQQSVQIITRAHPWLASGTRSATISVLPPPLSPLLRAGTKDPTWRGRGWRGRQWRGGSHVTSSRTNMSLACWHDVATLKCTVNAGNAVVTLTFQREERRRSTSCPLVAPAF